MVNVNNLIGKKYLKVDDVRNNKCYVIIGSRLVKDKDSDDDKLEVDLEFNGEEKKYTLNDTNMTRLKELYGQESDNWVGKVVVFKIVETTYKGKAMDGIRVDKEETVLHPKYKA